MFYPQITERRADTVGKGVFLIGLGILFLFDFWWPGILIVLLASIGVRHLLLGRYWEMALLFGLLIILFVVSYYHIEDMYIIPSLLILGGTYFIVREFFIPNSVDYTLPPPSTRGRDFDDGKGDA